MLQENRRTHAGIQMYPDEDTEIVSESVLQDHAWFLEASDPHLSDDKRFNPCQ